MPTNEELNKLRDELRRDLERVEAAIRDLELQEIRDELGLYVGCVVACRGKEYKVSRIGRRYVAAMPDLWGYRRTKNGWHSVESSIYGDIEVIEGVYQ